MYHSCKKRGERAEFAAEFKNSVPFYKHKTFFFKWKHTKIKPEAECTFKNLQRQCQSKITLDYTISKMYTIHACDIQFVMDDAFSVSRKSADQPHYLALFTASKIY